VIDPDWQDASAGTNRTSASSGKPSSASARRTAARARVTASAVDSPDANARPASRAACATPTLLRWIAATAVTK
jgi:hypothetical protein